MEHFLQNSVRIIGLKMAFRLHSIDGGTGARGIQGFPKVKIRTHIQPCRMCVVKKPEPLPSVFRHPYLRSLGLGMFFILSLKS